MAATIADKYAQFCDRENAAASYKREAAQLIAHRIRALSSAPPGEKGTVSAPPIYDVPTPDEVNQALAEECAEATAAAASTAYYRNLFGEEPSPEWVQYARTPMTLALRAATAGALRAPPEKGERIPSGEGCDDEGFELVGCEMCDATPRMEDATRGEEGWFCPKCTAEWQAAHDACTHELTDDTDEFGDACKYCAKCCSRDYPDAAASPPPAKAEDGMREEVNAAALYILERYAPNGRHAPGCAYNPGERSADCDCGTTALRAALAKEGKVGSCVAPSSPDTRERSDAPPRS